MLRVVWLGLIGALGGACSFDTGGPSAGPGADASSTAVDAAADGPDAGGGAAADASAADASTQPELVEHIDVPTENAPIVASNTELTIGVTYELRASGTLVLSSEQTLTADAEYWWPTGNEAARADTATAGDTVDIGLAINDTVVDETTNPAWGDYAADHVYSWTFVGEGETITAQYHDLNAGNNSGTLSLDIYTVPD